MEKRTPHYRLALVKALIQEGKVRITATAAQGGASLGFDLPGIVEVALALELTDFQKSMTTYADHRIWQDVYHPVAELAEIYLKLTVIDGVVIVSFKEL